MKTFKDILNEKDSIELAWDKYMGELAYSKNDLKKLIQKTKPAKGQLDRELKSDIEYYVKRVQEMLTDMQKLIK